MPIWLTGRVVSKELWHAALPWYGMDPSLTAPLVPLCSPRCSLAANMALWTLKARVGSVWIRILEVCLLLVCVLISNAAKRASNYSTGRLTNGSLRDVTSSNRAHLSFHILSTVQRQAWYQEIPCDFFWGCKMSLDELIQGKSQRQRGFLPSKHLWIFLRIFLSTCLWIFL